MLQKTNFVCKTDLPRGSEVIIKYGQHFEFTCSRKNREMWCKITNIKGDFEITQITRTYRGKTYDAEYNKYKNKFLLLYFNDCIYTFYITANIEMKQEWPPVTCQLHIPIHHFFFLKLCQFYKFELFVPGYDAQPFTCYVTKLNNNLKENDIEFRIENPWNVQIQGKTGEYTIKHSSLKDINVLLTFRFDPNVYPGSASSSREKQKSIQTSAVVESRPESVISSPTSLNFASKLYKIGTDIRYADVIFITSDKTKIQSHRCIFGESSKIFAQIFDETAQTPVKIDVDDFNADTIQSALNFLYGKYDAINGKEMDVFKFAFKYDIKDLIEACCSFFEKSIDASNICEYIQIAYSNNFDELKKKCLKYLCKKKKEIDSSKVAELPKNILFDAFYF
uniref:BTB domain-containing protein n=1 Tax=Panagrolaimus sp. ES5 TaxID=591445 RepID=A0AC34FBY9_9BILA